MSRSVSICALGLTLVGLATAHSSAGSQAPQSSPPPASSTIEQTVSALRPAGGVEIRAAGFGQTNRVLVLGPQRTPREVVTQLCELTDSLLAEKKGNSGRVQWTIERRVRTRNLEAAWLREARLRYFGRMVDCMQKIGRKEEARDISPFGRAEAELIVQMGVAPLLLSLARDEWVALASEQPVSLPPGRLTGEQIRPLVDNLYAIMRPEIEGSGDPKIRKQAEAYFQHSKRELERLQKVGASITPDVDADATGRVLLLGRPGDTMSRLRLFAVPDEELALPVQGQNPYRWLERPASSTDEARTTPVALERRLDADLRVPSDGSWRSTASALCQAAGLTGVSDDYLSRPRSRRTPHRSYAGQVLALRGQTLKTALDSAGRLFGYLWWEKDGCLYFRSNTWVRDSESEVPQPFLAAWQQAGSKGRIGPAELELLLRLTPAQREGVSRLAGPVDGTNDGRIFLEWNAREALQFVSGLSAAQRAQLTGEGVTFTTGALANVPFTRRVVYRGEELLPGNIVVKVKQEISRTAALPDEAWRVALRIQAERFDRNPNRATAVRASDFILYIPVAVAAQG